MTGVIATIPRYQFSNALGIPLVGGKLYTYVAGTTTPVTTYQDQTLTAANENPICLDSTGSCVIWLDPAKSYKFALKSALGITQPGWPVDNITGAGSLAERLRTDLASTIGATLIKYGTETVAEIIDSLRMTDYGALRAYSGAAKNVFLSGYTGTASPSGIAGSFVRDDIDVTTSDNGGTVIVDDNNRRWKRVFDGAVHVDWFGADPTGTAFSTSAILAAIASVRANPVDILSSIGGDTITAHSSGTIVLGLGVYKVDPDEIRIYQDLGLVIQGQGSRRTNNAVMGATTLLVSGTSSGFGIKVDHNGGRGLTLNDFDLGYADSNFTGHLLDILDCPGVTLNRMHIGTVGVSAATRLHTALSCIRTTYDEFLTCNNCVFDGAVDGVWFDDARTEYSNTFGGSVTAFNQCLWYDFTGKMVRQDGLRTRGSLSFNGCAWNPISVDCVRAIDLNNIDGLTISGGSLSASVGNKPTIEWIRLVNCTGKLSGLEFNDLASAGTVDGILDISGNRIFCIDGFTIAGGVISGKANEFSKCTSAWKLSPTYPLVADLGPDYFKSAVTYSYDIAADSANLSGNIRYSSENDGSVSKFRNATSRVTIANIDRKQFPASGATYTLSITDTGRTVLANGASAQTFTLPTPVPGTSLTISKVSSQNLTLACAPGTNFYGTGSAYPSSESLTGAAMGTLSLEAYATVGWLVKAMVGSWSFA